MSNRLPLFAAVALCAQAQSQAAVVLTQINPLAVNPTGNSSQIFEAANAAFRSVVIDDFTVAVPTTLNSISVVFYANNGVGVYSQVTAWNVEVYNSIGSAVASLTGDVASQSVPNASSSIAPLGTNAANYQIVTLPISLPLTAPGTYYIGVSAVLGFDVGGQVFLVNAPGTGGNNATLTNPGGGFGLPGNQSPLTGDAFINLSSTLVPEPAGSGLLAAGCLLVAGTRRRR